MRCRLCPPTKNEQSMTLGHRASAKHYMTLSFTKLQTGIFATLLLALMAAFFSLGYLTAERGASDAATRGESTLAGLGTDKGEREIIALRSVRERETPSRSDDAIEPEFYQNLPKRKKDEGDAQAMEPMKLPGIKETGRKEKKASPKRLFLRSPAVVKSPPEEKRETEARFGVEPRKRAPARPCSSKPWLKKSGYAIQVVIANRYKEAFSALKRLRRAGFCAYIKQQDRGSGGMPYSVRVGHYRDRAEAQRALSKMRGRTNLRWATIVSI